MSIIPGTPGISSPFDAHTALLSTAVAASARQLIPSRTQHTHPCLYCSINSRFLQNENRPVDPGSIQGSHRLTSSMGIKY